MFVNIGGNMFNKSISVLVVAYNQEKYIEQAIKSILAQDLTYIKEIVISDDASSDNTINIVKKYQLQYPELIKILEFNAKDKVSDQEILTIPDVKYTNIRKNYIRGINVCSGDYIAILEGDDYWHSGKIKYFTDFMSNTPLEFQKEYPLYFHKYEVLQESKISERYYEYNGTKEVTIEDSIQNYQIQNLSCCIFDTKTLKNNCERFKVAPGVDYPLNLLILEEHPALFLNSVQSVYRISPNGTWASFSPIMQCVRCILRKLELDLFFDNKYSNSFNLGIEGHVRNLLSLKDWVFLTPPVAPPHCRKSL